MLPCNLDILTAAPSEILIEQLERIGQFHLLGSEEERERHYDDFQKMCLFLDRLHRFYEPIGGIIGYHQTCLRYLKEKGSHKPVHFLNCRPTQISHDPILWQTGLVALPLTAEIYPVGGAGTRLGLKTALGEPAPVACLEFAGKTLLQHLFDDIKGRELLYQKEFGESCTVPIALMLNDDLHLKTQILQLLEKHNFFGRPKESVRLFEQPLVPIMDQSGQWQCSAPFRLLRKPGGHGMLWKAAQEQGVFQWLHQLKKRYLLVRQINNPVVGLDDTLLSLIGFGVKEQKQFGFLCCPKLPGSAEGALGVIEERKGSSWHYHISNIEYTDFAEKGVADGPEIQANTNVLFAEISALEKKLCTLPFPGLVVNTTKSEQSEIFLETCMQNICDAWVVRSSKRQDGPDTLSSVPVFLLQQERRKAISATKRSFCPGKPLLETPPGSFYDLMHTTRSLLVSCAIDTPNLPDEKEYVQKGPSFVFLFHPVLGPLFSLIRKKLHGGRLTDRSFVQLSIADLFWENLSIDGGLLIESGPTLDGRCVLRNVKVQNQGKISGLEAWKGRPPSGLLKIFFHGPGEFIAEDVILSGPVEIHIHAGEKVVARSSGSSLTLLRSRR